MFWSKKFVLSDTNSLEQFADRPEVANSLNNFKHKLKDHFLRNLETWSKMPLLIDAILGT